MTSNQEFTNGSNSNEILEGVVEKTLNKVVTELTGCKNVGFCIEPASEKGDNFQGNISRILFKRPNGSDEFEKKSLILKVAPKNVARRQMAGSRNVFLREISMYDEVLAYFREFQVTKGVDPKENGFNEYPECYSTICDELSETLLLEDLKIRHFDMINLRQEELTFDHVSLMMKALGKFHAISFALKDQQPQKFKQLKSHIFEQFWSNLKTEFKDIYEQLLSSLTECLKKENRPDLLEKFQRFVGDDICAKILELVSSSSAEPYSVICHGDATTNNSMFRKDDRGRPIEVQIIDWQFSRYASPVTDLMLYLLCSTSKQLRDKHYDEFLRIYHESLSDLLKRLGTDPDQMFPFEELLKQCQKYGGYAAFVGVLLLPMLHADRESMPDIDDVFDDMDKLDDVVVNFGSNVAQKAYSKRVVDMFDDMAHFSYI